MDINPRVRGANSVRYVVISAGMSATVACDDPVESGIIDRSTGTVASNPIEHLCPKKEPRTRLLSNIDEQFRDHTVVLSPMSSINKRMANLCSPIMRMHTHAKGRTENPVGQGSTSWTGTVTRKDTDQNPERRHQRVRGSLIYSFILKVEHMGTKLDGVS